MAVGKKELSFLAEGFEPRARKSDGTVWNVFVQILLPLILILTFVAVLDILKYKDVAEAEKVRADKYRGLYMKEKDPKKEVHKLNATIIQLQYLKLLNALKDVKDEKRGELKLIQLPDASRINLKGTKVIDIDFRELCKETKNIYDNNGEQRFKNGIYKKVIQKADVKDTEKWGTRVRQRNSIPEDETYVATLSVITPGNRAKMHNEIIEFVETLKKETRLLQTQLLHHLFEELIKNPEELDETSRRLGERIISARDEEEGRRLANDFYQKMIRRWRKQLKKEGYIFLEDTWDKLRALS